MSDRYVLKLYISGQTARSRMAIGNLVTICETKLAGKYDLSIIDLLDKPHLAEKNQIIATPTLIKELPEPLQRIIGDLSNKEKVLVGLDLINANA